MLEIEFRCAECGRRNELELEQNSRVTCQHCRKEYGEVSSFSSEQGVSRCAICGCRDLFIQKDFNRKVGLTIVVIGAILAPFTKLISLFVCALIDLILYRILPMITICYRCHAIYRGFPGNSSHEGFNLGINDRYRSMENKQGQV
jgi:DNA-directed RNA polymerase subunit RPC12/RpoP